MANELLPLARMARRAGVPQQWLRDQADSGRVPHLRAGARYLFESVTTLTALAELAKQLPIDDNAQQEGRRND